MSDLIPRSQQNSFRLSDLPSLCQLRGLRLHAFVVRTRRSERRLAPNLADEVASKSHPLEARSRLAASQKFAAILVSLNVGFRLRKMTYWPLRRVPALRPMRHVFNEKRMTAGVTSRGTRERL